MEERLRRKKGWRKQTDFRKTGKIMLLKKYHILVSVLMREDTYLLRLFIWRKPGSLGVMCHINAPMLLWLFHIAEIVSIPLKLQQQRS